MSRAPGEGALLRSTIDALSAHIAVLDASGTIIAVNEAWRRFGRSAGLADTNDGVGTNYLAVCERASPEAPEAAAVARGLRAIMARECCEFRMEYPCASPDGMRWFQLRVTRPLDPAEDRLVVAHEDITEAKHAEEALARLSARLLAVQDEERRRIARELHDTTAQNLLALILNLTRLEERVRRLRPEVRRIVDNSINLAEQSLREIRTLSYLLHPPFLDEIGLASAIRWYAQGFAERSGIAVELAVEDGDVRLPAEVETALFRVLQESLSNIHRHSGSGSARVALLRDRDEIRLEVEDAGRGLGAIVEAGDASGVELVGVGIAGMKVRLRQLGGTLSIASSAHGTLICATVPLPKPAVTAAGRKRPRRPLSRKARGA